MSSTVRVTRPHRGVSSTVLYEAVDAAGRLVDGPRIGLVGLVHGNEVVGGYLLQRLGELIDGRLVAGSILAVRANEAGAAVGQRYTDGGTDMNRLWDAASLERLAAMPEDERCYEESRALELAPLLIGCDAILDLHSTTRPSPPFLVMRDDQRHLLTGYRLRVNRMVTGLHEAAILPGGVCPDVGLRRGEQSTRLGFTLEAGQHDDPANVERAWQVVARLLATLGVWSEVPPEPQGWTPEVFEVIDRVVQVPAGNEPHRFVGYVGGEPGGGRRAARRNLASFEDIEAGEIVMRRGHTGVLRAQYDFTMLLPTPAAVPGEDLYYVTQRRETGLMLDGAVRAHDQAFREAQAIERMLDLLADDAYARGESLVCFDPRMALDMCAELLGRTLRLPLDHPHRRYALVGRGDWGSGDAERRAGRRYRQALRRVTIEGVPSERFQLMRGATMQWIGQLTSDAMRTLLERRRGSSALGGSAPPTRVWLSERQPNTVSVVVVGDLARALKESDTRHVRVGLIVEAATVEPDAGQASVHIVRAGLFSSRLEILHAVARLLSDLRAEHRHIISMPPLSDDAAFQAQLLEDGSISPRADEPSMHVLRSALARVQANLWRERISTPVRAHRLADPAAVGRWVAATAVSTGILDEETIRRVFLRQDEDGAWWVAPEGLQRFLSDPVAFATPPSNLVALPRAPLLAVDVHADNLPGWLGWKRYLRTAQVVPDTRGKDIDLAFTAPAIRRRLAAWYRRARELAARAPGDVLVLVASDGATPQAPGARVIADLHSAHLDLVRDPNVQYVRVQHAAGTNHVWLRDFVAAAGERPAGGAPLVFGWETEHGASASVVLVAVRERTVADGGGGALNLDPWRLRACGVILAPARGRAPREHRMGVFSDRLSSGGQRYNDELLQFGRAHATRLIHQMQDVVVRDGGPSLGAGIERAAVGQLSRWIAASRFALEELMPADAQAPRWLAGHLGLSDTALADLLIAAAAGDLEPKAAAESLWEEIGRV